jgi:hypothetical protein
MSATTMFGSSGGDNTEISMPFTNVDTHDPGHGQAHPQLLSTTRAAGRAVPYVP